MGLLSWSSLLGFLFSFSSLSFVALWWLFGVYLVAFCGLWSYGVRWWLCLLLVVLLACGGVWLLVFSFSLFLFGCDCLGCGRVVGVSLWGISWGCGVVLLGLGWFLLSSLVVVLGCLIGWAWLVGVVVVDIFLYVKSSVKSCSQADLFTVHLTRHFTQKIKIPYKTT